ncbi:MAG: hypothetical protein DRN30_04160 [Thermoplasmata archaeon]|nr:MAG: hypothetical protein DRN30_04160 [Thermoplasmata archaeon]
MFNMIINNKVVVISVIVSLILGVAVGRYATPEKKVTVFEEKIVEKVVVVEKRIIVKIETKKTSKKTLVKTKKVTKPDGTIIEEKVETEEDTTFVDHKEKEGTETTTNNEKTVDVKKKREIKYNTKKLHVSLLVGAAGLDSASTDNVFQRYPVMYGVHASYKFFGPVSIGAFGTSTNEFGISVGLEF